MSKILVVSDDGSGCGIAMRMAEQGHDVAVAIRSDRALHVCDGLIPKVEEFRGEEELTNKSLCRLARIFGSNAEMFRPAIRYRDFGERVMQSLKMDEPDKDTTVVFDCTGMGWLGDLLLNIGHPTCGGSSLMDRLENDRRFCYQVMRAAGIKQPMSWFFTDWQSASDFLADRGKDLRLVFKPCGEHSGNVPSYVSKDAEDLKAMLKYFRHELGEETDFMLQEFVEGLEISTEIWLSQGKPLYPYLHNFETKALMEGNRGKSGGCTGAISWATEEDRVIRESVNLLLPWLEKVKYTGPIDFATITTKEAVYMLEVCPRPGYDTTPTWIWESFDGDLGKFFADLAAGIAERLPVQTGFAGGVRLTTAPWPSIQFPCPGDIPVRGIPDFKHFYPYDVLRNKEGDLVTAAAYGLIGIATGWGASAKDAMNAAFEVADQAIIPEVQYRRDLAGLFQAQYDKLEELLKE